MTTVAAIAVRGYGYGVRAVAARGFFGVEVANQVWYPPELLVFVASAGSLTVYPIERTPSVSGLTPSAYPSLVAFSLPLGDVSELTPIAAGSAEMVALGWPSVPMTPVSLGSLTMWEVESGTIEAFASPSAIQIEPQQSSVTLSLASAGQLTIGTL